MSHINKQKENNEYLKYSKMKAKYDLIVCIYIQYKHHIYR